MKCLRRSLSITILLLAASSALCAQQWTQVRSSNFTVITDAGESDARQLAVRLEQMRAMFSAIFHRESRMSTPAQTVIFAMKNPGSLASVGRQFKAAATDQVHVYHGIERWFLTGVTLAGNGTLADTPQNQFALRQFALMLLDYNYPRTPAWFDAGFAEYFASLQIDRDKIFLGRIPPHLSGTGSASLERTLASPPTDDPAFRREAWLLVHWILSNGRLPDAGKYFDLVMNRGVDSREACLVAFSMTPAEWQKELSTYDPAKNVQTFPAKYFDPQSFLGRKMIPPQMQVAVANMALDSQGDEDSAMKMLREIMLQNSTLVEAHRALAYGYVRRKNLDNGMEHVHRALELFDDPMTHFLQGIILNKGNMEKIEVESASVKLPPAFTNATKLDSQFAPAYELRGLALLTGEKKAAAMADLRIASILRPRDEHARMSLALGEAAIGDLDSARALYALVARGPDAALAAQAREAMAHTQTANRKQQKIVESYAGYRDQTDPRWRVPSADDSEEKKAEQGPDTRKTEYLKGTIVSTECGDDRSATLRVSSAGRPWSMRVADRRNVLLVNRQEFSCTWKNLRTNINYKSSGPQSGDVVSIEIVE